TKDRVEPPEENCEPVPPWRIRSCQTNFENSDVHVSAPTRRNDYSLDTRLEISILLLLLAFTFPDLYFGLSDFVRILHCGINMRRSIPAFFLPSASIRCAISLCLLPSSSLPTRARSTPS